MYSANAASAGPPVAPFSPRVDAHNNGPPIPCSEMGKVFASALACLAECQGSGRVFIEVSDVVRYCALLCGQHLDNAGRPFVPVPHFLALDEGIPLVLGASLPVSRCVMLASLYIAVRQERAFLDDQSFDLEGLYGFVKACIGNGTADKAAHIALLLGHPNTSPRCFREIVLAPLGNQFELRPGDGPPLRLGMAKLIATNATDETMNASWLMQATLQDCHFTDLSLGPVDMTGLRFQRCSLHRVSMIGTQLRKTQWQNVTLSACRFDTCCVELAHFVDSTFQDVGFTGCNLSLSGFFSTAMEKATFADCTLDGVTLCSLQRRGQLPSLTTLSKIAFHACAWRNTTIKGIRFQESTFSRLTRRPSAGRNHLEGCVLMNCTIDVACQFMDNIVDSTFNRCTLRHANFAAVRFRSVDFQQSTFVQAKFDLSEWRGGTISACHGLASTSFSRAILWDVVMTGGTPAAVQTVANRKGIDFSFATIHGGAFRGLRLGKASFQSVQATNVQWEHCTLVAANFSHTRFDNVVFSACQLHNANFTKSTGADWVSRLPNGYAVGPGDRRGLTGEPSSFALRLESAATFSDPIQRVRLITERTEHATADLISLPLQTAATDGVGTATLLDNILALPSVHLRQLAMISLINVLNAQVSQGKGIDDADVLLPLLCHAEFVLNPILEAFLERRIARLLSGASAGTGLPNLEPA